MNNAAIFTQYANVYHAIGEGRFSQQLAQVALRVCQERGLNPTSVLDLACGCGDAALWLAQAGCQVTGVDRSAAMLAVAQGRARDAALQITWIEADLRSLEVGRQVAADQTALAHGQFDLITSWYDSLNYLTNDGDLDLVFQHVAALLAPNGRFLFDLNTETAFLNGDGTTRVIGDEPGLMVYQHVVYDQQTRIGRGKVTWFARDDQDRWWRGGETHTERAWSDSEVTRALTKAGLQLEARLTTSGELASADATRIIYLVRQVTNA